MPTHTAGCGYEEADKLIVQFVIDLAFTQYTFSKRDAVTYFWKIQRKKEARIVTITHLFPRNCTKPPTVCINWQILLMEFSTEKDVQQDSE